MIYELSVEQYDKLRGNINLFCHQYLEWQTTIKELYHLNYTDFDYEPIAKRPKDFDGHWGMLEGDEKYITMLLLTL